MKHIKCGEVNKILDTLSECLYTFQPSNIGEDNDTLTYDEVYSIYEEVFLSSETLKSIAFDILRLIPENEIKKIIKDK